MPPMKKQKVEVTSALYVMTLRSLRHNPSDEKDGFLGETCFILGIFQSKLDAVAQIPSIFKGRNDYQFQMNSSQCDNLQSPRVIVDNRSTPPNDGIILHYQYGEKGEFDKIIINKRIYNSVLINPTHVFVMILSSYRLKPGHPDVYKSTFAILGIFDSVISVVEKIPRVRMPAVGMPGDEYFPRENFAQDEYPAAIDNRRCPPDSGILVSVGDSESQSDAISVEKMALFRSKT
jgi:hypothetical protein